MRMRKKKTNVFLMLIELRVGTSMMLVGRIFVEEIVSDGI